MQPDNHAAHRLFAGTEDPEAAQPFMLYAWDWKEN